VWALLHAAGLAPADCTGVSFAFCGIVDAGSGRVVAAPRGKFEDARELDLAGWSRSAFGLPLRLENDARLALLGEHWSGAARGYEDVAMITLGTGVGGAAMVGGRLLASRHHQAGVIGGHIPVSIDGRPCCCGGSGCAEAEASTWALPAICADWPGFADSSLATEERIDYRTLFRHYESGDAVAAEVLERSCGRLGDTRCHPHPRVRPGDPHPRRGRHAPQRRGPAADPRTRPRPSLDTRTKAADRASGAG
jgi:glucokinase